MKFLILIIIIALLFLWAYFFPKGVKIFGIPAETLFKKEKGDKNDID